MSEPTTHDGRRRAAAVVALALVAASTVLAIAMAVASFPRGLTILACLAVAVVATWAGLRRRGAARLAGIGLGAILLIGALVLMLVEGPILANVLLVLGILAALAAAGAAFRVHTRLQAAATPQRPVLFYNPKSGGGKAERFHLADEALARGIRPVELQPRRRSGDARARRRSPTAPMRSRWPAATARRPSSRGGRGARSALRLHPRRTRNHFALDLGVDRDDVVGALDAFVDGRERRGRPGGGQRPRLRQQRLARAVRRGRRAGGLPRGEDADDARHCPTSLGPGASPDLRWTEPGRPRAPAARDAGLQQPLPPRAAIGSGTRPRLDDGRARRRRRRRRRRPAPPAQLDGAGVRGRRGRPGRRPASTARPSISNRRCASAPAGGLRVRSRRHPGASPYRRDPGRLLGRREGPDPDAEGYG